MCCPYIAALGLDASDRTGPGGELGDLRVYGDGYDMIQII